jgi:hypothetical protein
MEEGSWLHPGVPWIDILSYVSAEDLLRLRLTCLSLRQQAEYEGLWKPHCAALFSFSPEPHCSWRESFTYLAATPFLSAETYTVYCYYYYFFFFFSSYKVMGFTNDYDPAGLYRYDVQFQPQGNSGIFTGSGNFSSNQSFNLFGLIR